jgi:electron transfer flavoprotein beta subunit
VRSVVLVKQVPDTYNPRNLDPAGRIVRTEGEQVCDEICERALEFALRQREEAGGGEVVALLMGPPDAKAAVRHVLAMGADRAVHVCDDRLAGADQLQTASALGAALLRESPDLVVAGSASTDGGGSVVAALLAQILQLPLLAGLASAGVEDGRVTGTRVTELGEVTVRAVLPAIVTVTDQIAEPRLPTLRGVLGARRKPQAMFGLSALGVAGTEPSTAVVSAQERPRHSGGPRLVDDGTAVGQLADYLTRLRVV